MSNHEVPQHGDDMDTITWEKDQYPLLTLDSVGYHRVGSGNVHIGYSVPVMVDDDDFEIEAMMLAGSVGLKCQSSSYEVDDNSMGLNKVKEGQW